MGLPVVISLDEVWRRYEADEYQGTPTISVDQTRRLLGHDNVETTYRCLRKGLIPAYKVGGSWVIYRDMLRDFMEAERTAREQHGRTE